MKAIAYRKSLPISDEQSLIDVELPDPMPGERDLLVEVHAISVNPVDTKIRANVAPAEGEDKVLGWTSQVSCVRLAPACRCSSPATVSGMRAR